MTAVILDTGALIGFERNQRRVVALIARAVDHQDLLVVPAGVVAQAWRDGARQSRLARLLGSPRCQVLALDDRQARAAGQLCGVAGRTDIVDASVAVAARDRTARVITSDPDDLHQFDPHLDLIAI